MILAGDVGGTKTLLGLFERDGRRLKAARIDILASADWPTFEAMIAGFLAEGRERPRRAAIGVAGPIFKGKSQVVNLRWAVDARKVSKVIGNKPVALLNDLEASAHGLNELAPRQLVNLTPALRPGDGNAALISPGTGLGMAILVRDGGRLLVSASEGGHVDFAPRDAEEAALLEYVQRRHPRVSQERIVAGPGFSAIYDFLVDTGREKATPAMLKRLASGDRNAAVSEAGVEGSDPAAERAVEMFVSLLGAAAGNLALVAKASGGVFVGGGIPPRILPKLREGTFLESFRAKGRLRTFLETVPVKIVVEPRLGLFGAAAFAAPPRT
jgi:glucokinase